MIFTIDTPLGTLLNASAIDALADGASQAEIDAAMADQALDEVRARRNAALAASDWAMMPDAPLAAKAREAWVGYRQSLRDLPSIAQKQGVDELQWPVAPNKG